MQIPVIRYWIRVQRYWISASRRYRNPAPSLPKFGSRSADIRAWFVTEFRVRRYRILRRNRYRNSGCQCRNSEIMSTGVFQLLRDGVETGIRSRPEIDNPEIRYRVKPVPDDWGSLWRPRIAQNSALILSIPSSLLLVGRPCPCEGTLVPCVSRPRPSLRSTGSVAIGRVSCSLACTLHSTPAAADGSLQRTEGLGRAVCARPDSKQTRDSQSPEVSASVPGGSGPSRAGASKQQHATRNQLSHSRWPSACLPVAPLMYALA